MRLFDWFHLEPNTRLVAIDEAADAEAYGFVFTRVVILLALIIGAYISQSWWFVVVAVIYKIFDISYVVHVRQRTVLWNNDIYALRALILHRWGISVSFVTTALALAYSGDFLEQLGALMLLTGLGVHMLASRSNTVDLMIPDITSIAISTQVISTLSVAWTEPMERPIVHLAMAMMVLFLGLAAALSFRVHQRLRTTSRRLAHAERAGALGQMTSGIAHDFNNLLTVLRGNLDLMPIVAPQERPALLAQIREAAERGEQLVARLSEAGRPIPGRPRIARVDETVQRAMEMVSLTLRANIQLVEEIEQEVGWVRADAAEFELALLNLLNNAADALPDGGTIRIRARRALPGWVQICVEDDGVGMSPDQIARATEPFETSKPSGEGTGLGLAMVAAFIDHAEGQLSIESEMNQGTRIRLSLPGLATLADEDKDSAA